MNKVSEERALHLHKKSIIIDASEYAAAIGNIEYFDKLIEAGVTAGVITICRNYATPLEALMSFKTWYDLFEKHGDKVMLVTTGRDVEKAKRENKFGVIMCTQNGHILGNDLSLLPVYKRAGLRIIQLTYYEQNLLGEGCGERTNSGLSNFGISVVEEMNRLKLLVDVAHSGDQAVMDAIKYSKDPIVISHANARGLVDHSRNKTDEQIKALAEKGGVIGLAAWSLYCEVRKDVRPTFEDFLDIVDYTVKLVGPDYVGLGFDLSPFFRPEDFDKAKELYPNLHAKFGWIERTLFTNREGFDDITRLPEITKGLVARGYSDQDIEKILGLNFLRVFRQVCGD